MKKKSLSHFLLAVLIFMLSACATTPVAVGLIEKPKEQAKVVRVIYVESRLSTNKDTLNPQASNALYRVGYFGIGEKIKNLAPELLAKRGMKVDAASIKEEVLIGSGYSVLKAKDSDDKPLQVLLLSFTKGQTTNYGGAGAVLNLQASFSDAHSNKIYWKGEYKNVVKETLFGGVTFDDKYINEMLNQVFLDMEKSELIPALKPT